MVTLLIHLRMLPLNVLVQPSLRRKRTTQVAYQHGSLQPNRVSKRLLATMSTKSALLSRNPRSQPCSKKHLSSWSSPLSSLSTKALEQVPSCLLSAFWVFLTLWRAGVARWRFSLLQKQWSMINGSVPRLNCCVGALCFASRLIPNKKWHVIPFWGKSFWGFNFDLQLQVTVPRAVAKKTERLLVTASRSAANHTDCCLSISIFHLNTSSFLYFSCFDSMVVDYFYFSPHAE